eukprot:g16518.t1
MRLRKLHSAPIKDFLSTGMDMDSLRLSYAAKLVLAAVEGRHVESAVDLLLLKGGVVNPLAYPLYSPVLVCIILGHLALALWEGGISPFPLHPAVAAAEACVALFYAAHILLNLWTFGVKQYRDKKWHFTFTVLAIAHLLLMVSAALAAHSAAASSRTAAATEGTGAGGVEDGAGPGAGATRVVEGGWWSAPRLALLGAQALRPMMLISNLKTIRRVFTNVLRTLKRTGSILTLGAVVLAFYSVLGINLFNSEQVSGYDLDRDNFDNFGRALLSLFVLVTEENFPEVADPSFTQRPLVAFPFFISFLLLFLVVILPLLLGIVLDAYAQQHARQHERYRRKARNALLAAYFILDEDGVRGLSRDELVGVLTTEAGVGIDTEQAEQLWQVIVPEEDYDWRYGYSRSFSVPVETDSSASRWGDSAAPVVTRSGNSTANGGGGSGIRNTAGDAFQVARSRARSLPHGPGSGGGGGGGSGSGVGMRRGRWRGNGGGGGDGDGGGRMDVRGFLRLADLLHQRVVDDGEGGGFGGGGKGSGRGGEWGPCYLAGFDDDGGDVAAAASAAAADAGGAGLYSACAALAEPGRTAGGERRTSGGSGSRIRGGTGEGGGFREHEDEHEDGSESEVGDKENSEHEDEDEDEDEDEEKPCCFLGGEEGRGHGRSSRGGGGGIVVNGSGVIPLSRRRRVDRWARRALVRARAVARVVVGRRWFAVVSRGIAVSLTMLALAWTPLSQQRYDGCLGVEEEGCVKEDEDEDEVDYRREDLLRRLEGLVLLAFVGEMAAKVLAVGCRRLWRLHWAHRFDFVVLGTCLASYLFVGVPGNTSALYVDRHPGLSDVVELPRAVTVLRLVTVFPQLRGLVETMSTVAAMLVKIMVLYSCVSYTFATVGMAVFADAKSDLLEPRYSFSTLPEACMALFFMTVSNNWNDLLYPLVNSVSRRLVTVFPQLRGLVETMSTVAAMLVKIMVLYSCVSYTFATVGMAVFADAKSDLLEPRYSFSTLPEACMALFFMTVSNNWNDLLYPLVNSVRAGRWSSIYFVAYMLFCATMMLDVLVGVVIEGFRVSTKGPDRLSAEILAVAASTPASTAAKNGSCGAGSDSGGDLDADWDGGTSSGNSVGGDDDSARGGAGGSQRRQQQQGGRPGQRKKRPKLARKASQRKYTQVKAEDMFRPEAWREQGVWDEEDVRELDEAVQAVEGRLHQAWVSHVRQTGFVRETV